MDEVISKPLYTTSYKMMWEACKWKHDNMVAVTSKVPRGFPESKLCPDLAPTRDLEELVKEGIGKEDYIAEFRQYLELRLTAEQVYEFLPDSVILVGASSTGVVGSPQHDEDIVELVRLFEEVSQDDWDFEAWDFGTDNKFYFDLVKNVDVIERGDVIERIDKEISNRTNSWAKFSSLSRPYQYWSEFVPPVCARQIISEWLHEELRIDSFVELNDSGIRDVRRKTKPPTISANQNKFIDDVLEYD